MTAATATTVQYLNLAYFGRPADPASLSAFPATGMTDEQIVECFVKTNEYTTNTLAPSTVGSTINQTKLINTFYQRLFGRLAASVEISGWTNAIATGAVNENISVSPSCVQVSTCPLRREMRKVLVQIRLARPSQQIPSNNPASATYSTSAAITSAAVSLTESLHPLQQHPLKQLRCQRHGCCCYASVLPTPSLVSDRVTGTALNDLIYVNNSDLSTLTY